MLDSLNEEEVQLCFGNATLCSCEGLFRGRTAVASKRRRKSFNLIAILGEFSFMKKKAVVFDRLEKSVRGIIKFLNEAKDSESKIVCTGVEIEVWLLR